MEIKKIKVRAIEIYIKDSGKLADVAPVVDKLRYEIALIRTKVFGVVELPSWAFRYTKRKKSKTARHKRLQSREYPVEVFKKLRQIYFEAEGLLKKHQLPKEFKNVLVSAIMDGRVTDKDYKPPKVKTPHKIGLHRVLFNLHEDGYGYRKLAKKFKKPLETIRSAIQGYKSRVQKGMLN